MFQENIQTVVILDWKDIYGNQRFRFGPGEKDVIWLSGPDRIQQKPPIKRNAKGVLSKRNGKWEFVQYGVAQTSRS